MTRLEVVHSSRQHSEEEIASVMRNTSNGEILEAAARSHLSSLPPEFMARIYALLTLRDKVILVMTCRQMKDYCAHDVLDGLRFIFEIHFVLDVGMMQFLIHASTTLITGSVLSGFLHDGTKRRGKPSRLGYDQDPSVLPHVDAMHTSTVMIKGGREPYLETAPGGAAVEPSEASGESSDTNSTAWVACNQR
ncbi:hypothetical protein B0H14DRAFT_2568908 [Mycena olivaceomarginata]|nr:hypothetical protein B0H14DRAFT_2605433 [Mycena olivaceomarginata]KAJ7875136.1 hypothetical protein B0H14DRAFT_2568908 [Mycena olivaceomarginata]